MKYNQLYAELKAAGCYVVRHGGEHDVWFSPKTGKKFSIPRHGSKEVSLHIERNARKVLGFNPRTSLLHNLRLLGAIVAGNIACHI